jgi:hypothetical protein
MQGKCTSGVGSYRRHKWQEDQTCRRCGKKRNPKAGDKMFRVSIDRSKKEKD